MAMHPYRQDALVTTPAIPVTRRPRGAGWVAWVTGAAAVLSLAIDESAVLTGMTLVFAMSVDAMLEGRQRRRALATLADLPFPVHHDSDRALDPGTSPRPVTSLTIELKDGESIAFHDWTWGRRDIVRLAHILSTLGRDLDATRGVIAADVRWGLGGPAPSI